MKSFHARTFTLLFLLYLSASKFNFIRALLFSFSFTCCYFLIVAVLSSKPSHIGKWASKSWDITVPASFGISVCCAQLIFESLSNYGSSLEIAYAVSQAVYSWAILGVLFLSLFLASVSRLKISAPAAPDLRGEIITSALLRRFGSLRFQVIGYVFYVAVTVFVALVQPVGDLAGLLSILAAIFAEVAILILVLRTRIIGALRPGNRQNEKKREV